MERAAQCLIGAIFFSQGMQTSQVKPAGNEAGEQTPNLIPHPHPSLQSPDVDPHWSNPT